MASNVNSAESPTAKAMDRAIDLAIAGDSPYPNNVAFVTLTHRTLGTRWHARYTRATP